MHADELRLAIEQPAARHGVVFEQGLVEEIIKDVQGQAGSLPLLQYTLDLLWQEEARADGLADRHLNTHAHRELGGVRGSLQKRADEIYASFGGQQPTRKRQPRNRRIARQIFLRLVRSRRRRLQRRRLASRPPPRGDDDCSPQHRSRKFFQSLINQKLLVSNREGDSATVQLAHEALFTSWGSTQELDRSRQASHLCQKPDFRRRPPLAAPPKGRAIPALTKNFLIFYRLLQALDMRARGDFTTVIGGLGESENLFLDRSAALREIRARLRRVLEVVGIVLLLISIAGAIFGWLGQRNARLKADEARERAADAQRSENDAKRALSQTDFLRATDLLRDKDPRKTQAALAFLARACRTNPSNHLAASRLFSLLLQRNWILPLIIDCRCRIQSMSSRPFSTPPMAAQHS